MNNCKQGNEIKGKRNNNENRSMNYKLGKLVLGNRSEMASSNGDDEFVRRLIGDDENIPITLPFI